MRFRPRGLTRRAKTLGSILALVAITLGTQGPALANPVPDSGATHLPPVTFPVLPTLPFALGEVDLSSVGVTDEEVADAGLAGADTAAPMMSSAQKLVVDDDLAQCPDADFTTIQAAVGAAPPTGGQIEVCPGTYPEQVTIPTGKNGLVLFSKNPLAAVIKAPPALLAPGAIVRVAGAQNATIRGFTVTGPGPAGSGFNCSEVPRSLRWGVRVDTGGSATIVRNHITEIHDMPFSGCQRGIAVDIGRGNPADPDGSQVGSGTVSHNLIDNYQKGGVLVDGASVTATVEHNEIVGVGPSIIIAQNGIQISRNANANVDHNKVSNNAYTGPITTDDASGILLFSLSGGVSIDHNRVEASDLGIALSATQSTDIANNKVRNSPVKGVAAFVDSTSNLIEKNDAQGSGEHDCYDETVGPMNTWSNDKGDTQNQPGLCKKAEVTP
jgi:parallel beta helix pectate lyase-like protein